MKKIIGLILALIIVLSVCSFAVITSATGKTPEGGRATPGFTVPEPEDPEGDAAPKNSPTKVNPPVPTTPPADTPKEEPKEEPEPPVKTSPADNVAEYISKNRDGIEKDLKMLFESVDFNADCFIEAVEGKEEVNINIVLTGVSSKEKERVEKIKGILAEANQNENMAKDFAFFNKQCADVHKVNIQFFSGEAMKNGKYDANNAGKAKIGEIVLGY